MPLPKSAARAKSSVQRPRRRRPADAVRLFIAVTLPEPLKLAIHRATEPLRNAAPTIRWVSADQLHITLKFLGEVKEPAVPAIGAALEGTADSHAPFDLDFASARSIEQADPAKPRSRVTCTNFGPFQGHTSCVLLRLTRFEIELSTRSKTQC